MNIIEMEAQSLTGCGIMPWRERIAVSLKQESQMDIDRDMVLWCAIVTFAFCLFRLFRPLQEEDAGVENRLRNKKI